MTLAAPVGSREHAAPPASTHDARAAWVLRDHAEVGYEPGLIGEVVALHARTYAPIFDVGARFEAERAHGFADFAAAFDVARDGCWTVRHAGRVVASAALDGRERPLPELRWVAVDPDLRGHGLGRALVATALDHARASGYAGVALHSHDALREAIGLYRSFGFVAAGAVTYALEGRPLPMQRYERRFDLGA